MSCVIECLQAERDGKRTTKKVRRKKVGSLSKHITWLVAFLNQGQKSPSPLGRLLKSQFFMFPWHYARPFENFVFPAFFFFSCTKSCSFVAKELFFVFVYYSLGVYCCCVVVFCWYDNEYFFTRTSERYFWFCFFLSVNRVERGEWQWQQIGTWISRRQFLIYWGTKHSFSKEDVQLLLLF